MEYKDLEPDKLSPLRNMQAFNKSYLMEYTYLFIFVSLQPYWKPVFLHHLEIPRGRGKGTQGR